MIFAEYRLHPKLLVEPFAGGASVALRLLTMGLVEKIGLNDLDPLISSFWQVMFHDTTWLLDEIDKLEVTIDRWHEFKTADPQDVKGRALKCLFLNRTSFSGVLRPEVGPIGGQEQLSEYLIDCRFPKTTLKKRIVELAGFKDKVVFISNMSWENVLDEVTEKQQRSELPSAADTLLYLDPPFFEKAERLYNKFFVEEDHTKLRDRLVGTEQNWILSYDLPPKAKELYIDNRLLTNEPDIIYSISGNGKRPRAKEIILHNLGLSEESNNGRQIPD